MPSRRLSYFFLPLPFAAVAAAQEKFIRIGYAECASATNYSKATAEKIAQLKWFFAHASVGSNMMDGVSDLHSSDKALYAFQGISAEKRPPTATQGGVIYEHNRGNPGWKAKFDGF